MIEHIILRLIIIFEYLSDKVRGFQHIGWKSSGINSLLHPLHIFPPATTYVPSTSSNEPLSSYQQKADP